MTAREKIHALNSCHKYFSCPVPRVMSSSAEGEARPKGRKEVVWKCARELRLRRLLCLWSIKVAVHTLHHSRLFSSILHKITNFSYLHGIGGHLGCELFESNSGEGEVSESLPKNKAVMFPSQAKNSLFFSRTIMAGRRRGCHGWAEIL